MGREADINARIAEAEYERTVGPVREFGSVTECGKCGHSGQFAVAFCIGKTLGSKADGCRIEGEHLHFMCPVCRFGWNTRCKDWTPEREDALHPKPSLVTP